LPLTFAQAQVIVAMSAGIVTEKIGSLTSRMKQWQKMGFPEGTRGVGKGAKAEYGAAQIFQLLLMVRLLRLGATPDRAKRIIETGWDAFRHGIVHTLISQANADGERHYYLIQMDALSDLTTPGADHEHIFVEIVTNEELRTAWREAVPDTSADQRERAEYSSFVVRNRLSGAIIVEVDSLIYWVWACLKPMGIAPSVFAEEFKSWHADLCVGGHLNQPDEERFYSLSNRSAVEHDVAKIDLSAMSQDALVLIPDEYRNG